MIIRKWAPVILWMAVIFFLSAQSQLPSPQSRFFDALLEKTGHFLEYAVLAALLVRALTPPEPRIGLPPWHSFALALLIAGLYALSDEFHQSYVPGRKATWTDVFVDWLGAAAGAALSFRARSLWREEAAGKER
jgi:VanZ family protein